MSYKKHSDESCDIQIDINKKIKGLDRFSAKHKVDDTVSTATAASRNILVKLPKINIKNFHGDPTEWTSFFDCFEAAVHSNEHLSNVEKMTYLKNYVRGEAELAIKGLKLSNENYEIALDILVKRYGDPQILISAHMNELLNFEVISDINDVKALRLLYDHVETQVRSLYNLDITCKSYGPKLVPVLISKLPSELKLLISIKFGKALWDIENILEALQNEIEIRERVINATVDEHSGNNPFSAQSFVYKFPF